MQRGEYPYKNIGERLKKRRQQVHESVAEVSGAVEIDAEQLRKIENGAVLPSEDILLLLISHLDIKEKEARTIFEQAGYSKQVNNDQSQSIDEQLIKQMLMIIPFDNRILYSDLVNISANDNGVVMNFMQNTGNPQLNSIARIGMSVEHAKKMHSLLGDILKNAGRPKPQNLLEAPKETTDKQNEL